MRYHILIGSLFFAMVFSTCKKNNNNSSTNTPSANNAISGIFFNIRQVMNFVPTGTINTTSIKVTNTYFEPAVTTSQVYGSPYADVGDVYINASKLIKTTNPFTYDGVIAGDYPLTYSITGNGSFPALAFSDNGSLAPGFSNYDQFPNSVSKSAGLTFTLNNLVNTSTVEVLLNNNSFAFTNNIINITAAQLSAVSTSTFASIQIKCVLVNSASLSGGGKTFQYSGVFYYQKNGISILP